MVRQRPRKGIEELYGTSKLDKTNLTGNNGLQKNIRTEREYAGYLLQSTAPFSTTPLQSGMQNVNVPTVPTVLNTSRRKALTTARPVHTKADKLSSNAYVMDDLKKEMNKTNKMNVRQDKPGAYSGANLCDNKTCTSYGLTNTSSKDLHHNMRHQHQHQHQHPPHHHQHQRMAAGCDDEKEDETDEFFELIKHTVESAVGKTITELLNRNFRDLSTKIDRFSAELKSTNALLNKLQTDINHKVVHYGEENSRHFRYLCMKSEYDKMFYQHHTNIATSNEGLQFDRKKSPLNRKGVINEHDIKTQLQQQQQQQQQQKHQMKQQQQGAPCTCRTSRDKMQSSEITPSKTPSEEPSISQKSSEIGIRDMLEQIKRYCSQFHNMNEMPDDNEHIAKGGNTYRGMDAIDTLKVHKKVFEEDDDDDSQLSSDGMTPRSSEQTYHGNTTMRGNLHPGMGEGDN